MFVRCLRPFVFMNRFNLIVLLRFVNVACGVEFSSNNNSCCLDWSIIVEFDSIYNSCLLDWLLS